MANTIRVKRSSTASAVPLTSNLVLGEISINTYDGILFFKKNDGAESIVSLSVSTHNHSGVYEPVLGNPVSDGFVLTSTAAGVRSWVADGGIVDAASDGVTYGRRSGAWVEVIDTLGGQTISGNLTTTGDLTSDQIILSNTGRAVYSDQIGSYIQVGASNSGISGTLGSKQNTDAAALQYGTYWAYDCSWDDVADNWVAARTTLGNKWKVDMGYHLNEFSISQYNGDVTIPWADSAWSKVFSVSAAGIGKLGVNEIIHSGGEQVILNQLTIGDGTASRSSYMTVRGNSVYRPSFNLKRGDNTLAMRIEADAGNKSVIEKYNLAGTIIETSISLQTDGTVDDINGNQFIHSGGGQTIGGNLSIGEYATTNTGTLLLNGSIANKQSKLKCSDGNLHIESEVGNTIYLNYYDGTGGTIFGNGASGNVASINGSGALSLNSNATVNGITFCDQLQCRTAQQLVLNAGESVSYATGQTAEYVYVNAEAGLQVSSSPDNWATGWAGRKTTLIDSNGIETDGYLKLGANNLQLVESSSAQMNFKSAHITTTSILFEQSGGVNLGYLTGIEAGVNSYFGLKSSSDEWGVIVWNNNNVAYVDLRYDSGVRLTTTLAGITVAGIGEATDWKATSDRNLKDKFENIENALDKLDFLEPMIYEFKANKGKREAGIIAQSMQKALPEIVNSREDGMLTLSLSGQIAFLTAALQELKTEVLGLKRSR